jgi:hypothetical protein
MYASLITDDSSAGSPSTKEIVPFTSMPLATSLRLVVVKPMISNKTQQYVVMFWARNEAEREASMSLV